MIIPLSRPGWGCLLLVGGIGALVAAVNEFRLGMNSNEQPQFITCRQLIDKGPGDNLHVVVTGYQLEVDSFVVQRGRKKTDSWKKAWVPVTASDGGGNDGSFHVLFETSLLRKDSDLDQMQKLGELHGMIVNDITSLGSEEQNLLRSSYPKTDFSKCWILEHGRRPGGAQKVLIMIGLGIVGLLIGVLLFRGDRSKS